MDVILDLADEYVLDHVYAAMPAIPIPDLAAGMASLPSASGFYSQIAAPTADPRVFLAAVLSTFLDATQATGLKLNTLPGDSILRQAVSLFIITLIGGALMYICFASSSYLLVYDKSQMKHPKFLKNQVRLEIEMSLKAIPGIATLTFPWFLAEVRGYSQLYTHIHKVPVTQPILDSTAATIKESIAAVASGAGANNASAAANLASSSTATSTLLAMLGPLAPYVEPFTDGWGYVALSVLCFLVFTDFGIYWIHRFLHHPLIYKRVHKPHHKWIIPTPYASHAFHFLDGYAQSVPYHIFVFFIPMQKYIYLGMFAFVNFWSVLIHDGEYLVDGNVINSAAHHAVHHLYFNYNYGQYFTLWDRVGGSYRKPTEDQYNQKAKLDKMVWAKQAKDVDTFDDFGKPTTASDVTFREDNKAKGASHKAKA
ncbi:c-5 sterol desaturase, partial [Lunasporangiospora selenospora]